MNRKIGQRGWLKIGCIVFVAITVILFVMSVVDRVWPSLGQCIERLSLPPLVYAYTRSTDDQISTLWPLLVTLVITMLGSLITTYIFLKEALDRMVDERPYYQMTIKAYRDNTIHHLWIYLLWSFLVMGITVALYLGIYYAQTRTYGWLRLILAAGYIACMIYSAYILWRCIRTEKGLQKETCNLLKKREKSAEIFTSGISKEIFKLQNLISPYEPAIPRFLQINAAGTNTASKKKFIDAFSEWEKLLTSLLENDKGFLSEKSDGERLQTAIQYAEKGFGSIEKDDAESHGWTDGAYTKIKNCDRILKNEDKARLNSEKFCSLYTLLKEYRDLLQVQRELELPRGDEWIEDVNIEQVMLLFYVYLATSIFYILPKIEVFLPAENFQCANFYNSRIENSAFRASAFFDSVISRSRITNSNFALTYLKNCTLYSTDSRNCSYSNSKFETCDLREAIFDYVDLTGSVLQNCKIQLVKFTNSILNNVELRFEEQPVYLAGNNFSDSQIQGCQFLFQIPKEQMMYSIPYEYKTDLVFIEWKRLLDDMDLERYYCRSKWSESDPSMPSHDQILEAIQKFKIPNFQQDTLFSQIEKDSLHSCIVPHPFWNILEKQAVINMDENVFVNVSMPSIRFYRTVLSESVFSNAQMDEAELISLYMPGCIMDFVNLRYAILWSVNMKSSVLDDAIFYNAVCKLVNFEDASMRNFHASDAKFEYCLFGRSDCTKVDFTRAKVTNCSFRDTLLYQAEFTETMFQNNSLEGAIANKILASYTVFESCNMKRGLFRAGSFNNTVFVNCDFTQASFIESVFTDCTFICCCFRNSGFQHACFVNSQFENNMHTLFLRNCGCTFIQTKPPFILELRK